MPGSSMGVLKPSVHGWVETFQRSRIEIKTGVMAIVSCLVEIGPMLLMARIAL